MKLSNACFGSNHENCSDKTEYSGEWCECVCHEADPCGYPTTNCEFAKEIESLKLQVEAWRKGVEEISCYCHLVQVGPCGRCSLLDEMKTPKR